MTWDAVGRPAWREGSTGIFFAVALANAMLLDGEQERARRLLAEAIARTNHEIREQGRPAFWYLYGYALALALNGDREASIAGVAAIRGRHQWWVLGGLVVSTSNLEPAFVTLRQDPRFQELVRKAREHVAAERRELDRMRAEGLVPDRTAGKVRMDE